MLPDTNEPNGLNENQKRNESELKNDENHSLGKVDESQNSIAGNAAGNLPSQDNSNQEDEPAKAVIGKGFMGDFAEPQHDDQ